jgi:hypothetical protein
MNHYDKGCPRRDGYYRPYQGERPVNSVGLRPRGHPRFLGLSAPPRGHRHGSTLLWKITLIQTSDPIGNPPTRLATSLWYSSLLGKTFGIHRGPEARRPVVVEGTLILKPFCLGLKRLEQVRRGEVPRELKVDLGRFQNFSRYDVPGTSHLPKGRIGLE